MALFDKGGGNDPHQDYQNGLNQMQQMFGQSQQMFAPWLQYGGGALPQYQNAISGMMNPQQFYQQMMSGYAESPQAQLRQQLGEQAANRSGAASGMLGSGALQKQIANFTQQNIAADQQNYLNNMMGIYGRGMGGLEDLARMGLMGAQNAGQIGADYGRDMSQLYGQMGQEDWARQQQNNQNIWGMLGMGAGLAGNIIGML